MSAAWDAVAKRLESKHRARDLQRLKELLENDQALTEWELEAFPSMLEALKSGQDELTTRQREFVVAAVERLDLEVEYENLVSSGRVKPTGKEIAINAGPKVLKPPTRRRNEP